MPRSASGDGQPGLGGPHEDAPALLAPQHLVGGRVRDAVHVDLVELDVAATAPSLPQLRRADSRVTRPNPFVESNQVLADRGDGRGSAPGHGVALGRILTHRGVARLDRRDSPTGKILLVALQDRDVLAKRLGAFHDLELDVLQLRLPARQRGQLVLQRLKILGRTGPRLEPSAVARRAVANQLDIRLRLLDLALHVGERRTRVDQLGVEGPRFVLQRRNLTVLGQVRRRVVDLVEASVDGLEVEQRKLTVRVGFQRVLPSAAFAPTTNVQGSVRRVET